MVNLLTLPRLIGDNARPMAQYNDDSETADDLSNCRDGLKAF